MKGIVEASDFMNAELAKVPMGRFAEVEEITEAICFLASHMSSYMSGASIIVDGYVFERIEELNAAFFGC